MGSCLPFEGGVSMKWLRILIPLVIGVAAAGLNWVVLNSRAPAKTFVRVNTPVKANTTIEEGVLDKVELSGDLESLEKTAVPYSMRAVLFGRYLLRDLHKNDIILWQDTIASRGELNEPALPIPLEGMNVVPALLQVGDQIGFLAARGSKPTNSGANTAEPELDLIGPFRILSVGDQVYRLEGADTRTSKGTSDRIITIAVKLANDRQIDDPNIGKLLAALKGGESENRSRVYGVVLMPRSGSKLH